MVKPHATLDELALLYSNLMEEIKRRVDVIQRAANGQLQIPPMASFELCYLQLRKVCEVFALACLCAHREIPEVRSKSLEKTYNVDQIIKRLSDLHPDFYPVPTIQVLDPLTSRVVRTVRVESGFLTKDDLLKLYGECGNYLHRGSVRQLLTKWEPSIDFGQIKGWLAKIVQLLGHHEIKISQSDKSLFIFMSGKNDGKVHWAIMQQVSKV
jgi:hypothetical protein